LFREGGGEILKKSLFLLTSVALTLGGVVAAGQVNSADPQVTRVTFPAQSQAFSSNDIKVLGVLDDGQSSKLAEYTSTPKYRAFVFEGNGRDQVEVTVTGTNQKAYVALADSSLNPIASGLGRLAVRLPYHGPDKEAFYIVVKNLTNQPARLSVHLKKIAASPQPPDATR
jgi:hypothetical protein